MMILDIKGHLLRVGNRRMWLCCRRLVVMGSHVIFGMILGGMKKIRIIHRLAIPDKLATFLMKIDLFDCFFC